MSPTPMRVLYVLIPLLAACGGDGGAPVYDERTFVIRGASIVDGTGRAAFTGSVRVVGGTITEVTPHGAGETPSPPDGDHVYDASGLVLAPGFVDTHSHHDGGLLIELTALAAVSQGITTIVVGQDGGSPFPIADFFAALEATPAAVNVASYAGHGTLRRQIMGGDFRREATAHEVAAMQALLETELTSGALGLSTGLEYDPGIYSTTDEVVALAGTAATRGGRYISHMRSEDRGLREAIEETIQIAERARLPVQISHFKLAARSLWGQAAEILARLDAARATGLDITADVYPYEYWQSTMTVLFPERDFTDREAARFALEELVAPEGMLIGRFEPDPALEGRDPGRHSTGARHRSRHRLPRSHRRVAGRARGGEGRRREHRRDQHDRRRHRRADGLATRQRRVRRRVARRPPPRLRHLPEGARAIRARGRTAHPGGGRPQDDGAGGGAHGALRTGHT